MTSRQDAGRHRWGLHQGDHRIRSAEVCRRGAATGRPTRESLRWTPIAPPQEVPSRNVADLGQLLAGTIMPRDLHERHHRRPLGAISRQLRILFVPHHDHEDAPVEVLAERVPILGGVPVGMPKDVAERTRIEHPRRHGGPWRFGSRG